MVFVVYTQAICCNTYVCLLGRIECNVFLYYRLVVLACCMHVVFGACVRACVRVNNAARFFINFSQNMNMNVCHMTHVVCGVFNCKDQMALDLILA